VCVSSYDDDDDDDDDDDVVSWKKIFLSIFSVIACQRKSNLVSSLNERKKTNFINFSFCISKYMYKFITTTTPTTAHHYTPLPTTTTHHAMSAKKKKGLDTLPNEIRLELRRTITLKVYDCVFQSSDEGEGSKTTHT